MAQRTRASTAPSSLSDIYVRQRRKWHIIVEGFAP